MKNNKGFSLVELIIVIAIMAILVGVMAPQLIKYIEKSKIGSDTQLCDSVRTAITTAYMDPDVCTKTSAGLPTEGSPITATFSTGLYEETVSSILGTSAPSDQLKSTTAGTNDVKYEIENGNQVTVWVDSTTIGAGPNTDLYD